MNTPLSHSKLTVEPRAPRKSEGEESRNAENKAYFNPAPHHAPAVTQAGRTSSHWIAAF